MENSLKSGLKRQNQFASTGKAINCFFIAIFALCIVAITGCSSVGKEVFIQSVDDFTPGALSFSTEDISININQIEDKLAQQQVFQGIEPKIKSFNLQCNPLGQKGRLVLKINQRALWEGYSQKNSLAITGEIYNENQELLLQRTVLVSGKDSILQVKSQRKYIGSLIESLLEDWTILAPLESNE